jgi:hypothetical protein
MSDDSQEDFPRTRVGRYLNLAAVILGILANIVALFAFLQARKTNENLKAFIEEGKQWELSIKLLQPANGSSVVGYVTRVVGSVDIRTTAAEMSSPPKMNLALQNKKVELVPFVRPLSEAKWWWVQASPVVRQDGSFEGSVFIGESSGAGVGVDFQIVVLAIPKGSVTEGDKLSNLPFSYGVSERCDYKAKDMKPQNPGIAPVGLAGGEHHARQSHVDWVTR